MCHPPRQTCPVSEDNNDQRPRGRGGDGRPQNGPRRGGSGGPGGGRSFGNRDGGRGQRPRRDGDRPGFQRDDRRQGFRRDDNREGGFRRDDNREGGFRRDDRPRRDGDRPGFKRDDNRGERRWEDRGPREGGFRRDDRPRRDGDRPGFKRDDNRGERRWEDRGPREGGFRRDDRPRRDGDRPRWEDRSGEGRPRRDGDRPGFQRDDRRQGFRRDDNREGGFRRDDRPRRDGDRPAFRRDDNRGDRPRWEDRGPREDRRRDFDGEEREPYVPRPGLAPKEDEPDTPQDMDLRDLPRPVRAELRGLTPELAQIVGAHLIMAGQLISSDPQLAYRHAEAARRRAARLSITREATGETAYAAGEYQVALHEFRALRRMQGGTEYLAAMADCERALGRPEKALKLIREGLDAKPDFGQRVELRLVEAGARIDLGQAPEALRLLKHEIEASAGRGSRGARARLRYGYADLLEQTGDADGAEKWFAAAAALDTDGETDAADRVAALQGIVLEVDEDSLVGHPEDEAVEADEAEGAEEADDSADEEADVADAEAEESPEAEVDVDVEDDDIEAEVAELLGEDDES